MTSEHDGVGRPALRVVRDARTSGSKPRNVPSLLKCVQCERRSADTSWDKLPVCARCSRLLARHVHRHGRVVVAALESLKRTDSEREIRQLSNRVVKHAAKLVPYEDKRLTTLLPKPTEIIHHVRRGTYHELSVAVYAQDNGGPKEA